MPVIVSAPVKSWLPENFNVPAETLKGPVLVASFVNVAARPADNGGADRPISAVDIGRAGAEFNRACPADDLIIGVREGVRAGETQGRASRNGIRPVAGAGQVDFQRATGHTDRAGIGEVDRGPINQGNDRGPVEDLVRVPELMKMPVPVRLPEPLNVVAALEVRVRPVRTWLPLRSRAAVTAVVPPVPVSVPPLQVIVAVVRVPVPLKLPPDRMKPSAVVLLSPKSSEPEERVRMPPNFVRVALEATSHRLR